MNEAHSQSDPNPTPPKPASGVVVPRMVLPHGPETVVNPEGRPASEGASDHPLSPVPASSIVRSLFPAIEETQSEERSQASIGVQLGHFTILERIRDGGMGAVFRALDSRLNRVVALKVLPPALTRDSSSVQRFRNEAQAAAQLDHENIARVFYIGEDQGLHFIAFEFVSGTNLRDLIQQHGRLPVGDAVNYTLQIASALLHTSQQGVVHRDIKPSNIIITPSGRAKLVDLGLARKENKADAEADLTLAGTTLGTFDYISPEQARDPRTADVRSDIYSLGCTLYHMLTGAPPFPEGTVLQKLLQHQGDDAPDPSLTNRKVPDNLSAIVRKMMAKDPRRRYQSAEQLVRDLMLVAGSMGLRSISSEGLIWMSSQPPSAGFLERHLAWMATVAALLLIVGYMQFGGIRFSPHAGEIAGPLPPGQRSNDASGGGSQPAEIAQANRLVRNDGPDKTSVAPASDARTQAGAEASDRSHQSRSVPRKLPSTARTAAQQAPRESIARSENAQEPSAAVSLQTGAGGVVFFGPQVGAEVTALQPEPLGPGSISGLGPSSVYLPATVDSDESSGAGQTPAKPDAGTTTNNASASSGAESPARGESGLSDKPSPRPAEPVSAAQVSDAVSIVGADGTVRQSFRTLEAACAAAENGSIVELRFNGRRSEVPARITKRISIRAGKGFQPLIEFLPTQIPAEGYQTRMLTVAGGSLDLVGVDLLMTVRDAIPTDYWVLLSAQRPEAVRLYGVTLTIQNPRRHSAAFFELHSGISASMPDMEMGNNQPKPHQEVEVSASLARGDADLFLVRTIAPARLSVKESILALGGTLLRTTGTSGAAAESSLRLELRLEHVTALLAAGLLKLDSSDTSRRFPHLQVAAFNNIFTTSSHDPLISMSGNAPPQDFRPLLTWSGRKNFYDRFETFWSIVSTDGSGKADLLDFAAWQKNWSPAAEVDAHTDTIAWKREWAQKPLAELTASDMALDREAPDNAAVSGAANGSDAGANLPALANLGVSPDVEE